MGKHKYRHTPISWTIYTLSRLIIALSSLQALLIVREGKRK